MSKKTKKNIALVESPFQIIQLKEYMVKNQLDFARIIVRLNGNERNNNQILKTIKMLELTECRVDIYKNCFLPLINIVMCLSSTVIIGDENSIIFKIAKRLIRHDRFVLLDDGTATLKSILKFRRFSIFEEAAGNVSKNRYRYLKSRFSKSLLDGSLEPVALLIGGKFVEAGIVSEDFYLKFIEWQIRFIKSCIPAGMKIIYVPHRHEVNYTYYLARYIDKGEIIIEALDLPVELIAMYGKYNPVYSFGALSTALVSLREIYEYSVVIPTLMPDDRIIERREPILNLHSWFKKNFDNTAVFPME